MNGFLIALSSAVSRAHERELDHIFLATALLLLLTTMPLTENHATLLILIHQSRHLWR